MDLNSMQGIDITSLLAGVGFVVAVIVGVVSTYCVSPDENVDVYVTKE